MRIRRCCLGGGGGGGVYFIIAALFVACILAFLSLMLSVDERQAEESISIGFYIKFFSIQLLHFSFANEIFVHSAHIFVIFPNL